MNSSTINYITSSSGNANYSSSATVEVVIDHLEKNFIDNYILAYENVINWFLLKEEMTISKVILYLYYVQAWGLVMLKRKVMDISFFANNKGIYTKIIEQQYNVNDNQQYDKKYSLLFNNEILELLESVWMTYGNNSENSLLALIMSEKPYIDAISKLYNKVEPLIDEKSLVDYYKSIYIGK